MIPKKNKLQLRKIANFFQTTRRFYTQNFLFFYHRVERKESKIVVIIPKKSFRLRIKRSQVKRQVYSLTLPLIKTKSNLEIAIVVNKKFKNSSREEIKKDLRSIFSRIN